MVIVPTSLVLKRDNFRLDNCTSLVVKEKRERGMDASQVLRCWNITVEVATLVDLTASRHQILM